jgi:hypothetical protein
MPVVIVKECIPKKKLVGIMSGGIVVDNCELSLLIA